MEIPQRGLAIYTWGNVSAFDRKAAVFAIKPSGISYDVLTADDMVVVDLEGTAVWGDRRPSSDTETHRFLYRAFQGIGGITHTHSTYATAWAQAGKDVPVFGTTHADLGFGEIPCTAYISEEAVNSGYERETGSLIARIFKTLEKDPLHLPMALVAGHGPFTWGVNAGQSVYHAAALEEICKMAFFTLQINPDASPIPPYIINKHWERKHGPNAYYGQK
ncbi:MAG: L-ribulose-5-phosphate 4-epimerase AraD [Treponema sp.]|nr:L-ribulose-5-phosphate 4-epimerase AraD [Treponema sp.]